YQDLAAAPRLPLIFAAVTATVWALIGTTSTDGPAGLSAYLVVGALGVAMSYVDLREHLLPDWLTLPALAAAGSLLALAAATTGEWGWYGRAWAGAAVMFAFYLALTAIRPTDLGLGDVKLAAVIGLLLGWAGWTAVILGAFLAFLIGGLAGIVMVIIGKAGRHTAIPFGPSMLVGALAALVWGEAVLDVYLNL
ncbi:MAG: prepilin peptidase, partial [Jiangellaceae bacterium]